MPKIIQILTFSQLISAIVTPTKDWSNSIIVSHRRSTNNGCIQNRITLNMDQDFLKFVQSEIFNKLFIKCFRELVFSKISISVRCVMRLAIGAIIARVIFRVINLKISRKQIRESINIYSIIKDGELAQINLLSNE